MHVEEEAGRGAQPLERIDSYWLIALSRVLS